MLFLTLEIISVIIWALALPPMLVSLSRKLKPLKRIDRIKQTSYWMQDRLMAADRAGKELRGDDGKTRPIGAFVDCCCGLSTPFLLFFAITPWVWLNPWLLVGFIFYYAALMPMTGFLQHLYLLRFGYARLDSDDGDGGQERPSPEPPPFDGDWKPGPRGHRGQKRKINTRALSRGCGGQKVKERPLVSPGPR